MDFIHLCMSGTQGNPRIIKTFQASEKEEKMGNLLFPRLTFLAFFALSLRWRVKAYNSYNHEINYNECLEQLCF